MAIFARCSPALLDPEEGHILYVDFYLYISKVMGSSGIDLGLALLMLLACLGAGLACFGGPA